MNPRLVPVRGPRAGYDRFYRHQTKWRILAINAAFWYVIQPKRLKAPHLRPVLLPDRGPTHVLTTGYRSLEQAHEAIRAAETHALERAFTEQGVQL